MNDLIKINEKGKTTARELYESLQLNPAHFVRGTKQNITDNEFAAENHDWVRLTISGETPTGGKIEREDFDLSIDFAKKLCMVSKSERGEQARNYFIEVEKRFKQAESNLSTMCVEDMIIANAQAHKELRVKVEAQNQELYRQAKEIKILDAKIQTYPTDFFQYCRICQFKRDQC